MSGIVRADPRHENVPRYVVGSPYVRNRAFAEEGGTLPAIPCLERGHVGVGGLIEDFAQVGAEIGGAEEQRRQSQVEQAADLGDCGPFGLIRPVQDDGRAVHLRCRGLLSASARALAKLIAKMMTVMTVSPFSIRKRAAAWNLLFVFFIGLWKNGRPLGLARAAANPHKKPAKLASGPGQSGISIPVLGFGQI